MPDNTNKVSLVNPESNFFCHAEGIISIRDQGIKLGLDIYRFSTNDYYRIISHHRNALLPGEGNNKVYKPDIDTASNPNI